MSEHACRTLAERSPLLGQAVKLEAPHAVQAHAEGG